MDKFFAVLVGLGPVGVMLIATLDSAGIPLPTGVDALVITISVLDPSKAYLAALLAVIGSTAGNAFLYHMARKGGEAYLSKNTHSRRARKFSRWFRQYGLITVFIPTVVPIVPLPLKVFVLTAGATRVSFRAFIATIIAGRVPRFVGLAYLGSQIGENSMSWLRQHTIELTLVAVGLFLVLFALVRIQRKRRHIGDDSFTETTII